MIEDMSSIALSIASGPLAMFLYTFMAASLMVMLFIVANNHRRK